MDDKLHNRFLALRREVEAAYQAAQLGQGVKSTAALLNVEIKARRLFNDMYDANKNQIEGRPQRQLPLLTAAATLHFDRLQIRSIEDA